MIVVADTSPINYLLQIGHLEATLPKLYEHVVLPADALHELLDPGAPRVVRDWATSLPDWVTVHRSTAHEPAVLSEFGAGERSAISIALHLEIRTVLLDDLKARIVAESLFKLRVTGTLGVLRDAHNTGLLNAEVAYWALRAQTNFYCSAVVEMRFLESLSR